MIIFSLKWRRKLKNMKRFYMGIVFLNLLFYSFLEKKKYTNEGLDSFNIFIFSYYNPLSNITSAIKNP